jgi:hypothetical protein
MARNPRPDGFLPATASILPVDDRIDLRMLELLGPDPWEL